MHAAIGRPPSGWACLPIGLSPMSLIANSFLACSCSMAAKLLWDQIILVHPGVFIPAQETDPTVGNSVLGASWSESTGP